MSDQFGIKLSKTLKHTSNAIISGIFGALDVDNIFIDKSFIERFENTMIGLDISLDLVDKISRPLAMHSNRYIRKSEIKNIVYQTVYDIMQLYAMPIEIDYSLRPQTVLVCGVNGSGKTSTVGKMAYMLYKYGWKVTVGACDTFKHTAIEQLHHLIENSGVEIVRQSGNESAANVAKQSYIKAVENESNILLIDTAGRMKDSKNLMMELHSIVNAIKSLNPIAPHDIVLVVDATMSKSIASQIRGFQNAVKLTGLAVTKLDLAPSAGVVLSVVNEFKLPVHGVAVGNGIEDLQDFSSEEFAKAFSGLDY